MPVPKGYLLLPTNRIIKGRSSDLSKYYLKKYGHFFVQQRRFVHPLAHEFGGEIEEIIREPTKTLKSVRSIPYPTVIEENNRTNFQGDIFRTLFFDYNINTPFKNYLIQARKLWGRKRYEVSIQLYSSTEVNKVWSSPYVSFDDALLRVEEQMRRVDAEYDDSEYNIDRVGVSWVVRNPTNAQGGHRSIKTANKTWKIISPKTKLNCLYHSFIVCRDYTTENKGDIPNIVDKAKKLKKRTRDKSGEDLPVNYANKECIKALSQYTKTNIKLYNNIFSLLEIFECEGAVRTMEIQLIHNHFVALLRWKDIGEVPIVSEGLAPNKVSAEATVITKRKFENRFDNKYLAWDIEATGNDVCIQCGQGCQDEVCKLCGGVQSKTSSGIHKAYMLGVAWYGDDGEENYERFKGLDCCEQFLTFLYDNREKFNGYSLYAHNGGKYDLPMVMRETLYTNTKFKIEDNAIELNNAWIKMTITTGKEKMTFKDSLRLFGPGSSLEKLCKEFNVEHQKLTETVKHDDITLYNWDTFTALDDYLKNDCLGLLEVIDKFARDVWERSVYDVNYFDKKKNKWVSTKGSINITDCNTGASLSKKTFFNCNYNEKKYPVYTLNDEEDTFIRSSYYGGRTEIFKKLGIVGRGKYYYYDFTSLYPAMATKSLPYGKPFKKSFDENNQDISGYFGFVKCKVRSIDFTRKPIHAIYTNDKLLFPYLGEWRDMILFSEEIHLGKREKMYEYVIEEGIFFNQGKFMREFTENMFIQKQNATREGKEAYAKACKIILNSSYGFWGLRTKGRDSVVIGKTGDINLYEYLDKGTLISECENGQYTTLRVEKDIDIKDFNVSVASAISSYARLELWGLLDAIEKKGCNIFMVDTDSVICDCKLNEYPDLMERYMWDGCGDELGSLKNEAIDKLKKVKGLDLDKQTETDGGCPYFDDLCLGGCKFYSLRKECYNGEVIDISKCKGYKQVKGDTLSYERLIELEDPETILSQHQTQFRLPKSNYVSETEHCAMRTCQVLKKFNWIYNKANILDGNVLTTLVI